MEARLPDDNRMIPAGPRMIVMPGGRTDSKYDEAEFLVGGRGVGKGEIDSVTFKMHEGYIAECDKWIKSKLFPYKTLTDLVRHAIVRHVRWFLPTLEGEVEGSLLNELAQVDEIVAKWQFQNIFVKHIDNIAEQVNATLQLPNGRQEVARMLGVIKRRIDATRYSFYKGVYEKMFMDRFSAFLPTLPTLIEFKTDDGAHDIEMDVQADTQHARADEEDD